LSSGDFEFIDEAEYGSSQREQIAGIPGAKVERNAHGQYLVRGRLFDPKSKPKTFNQVNLTVSFHLTKHNTFTLF
jgi:hypothetical protein